jgi:bifunctional UDP-N-acetylglucosamine pyrophosphorylase/glucosamine-1-phosphate N-acetyltransferase
MSSDVKLITATIEDPTGYGRIVVENNKFVKIVEQKDCDRLQLDITKVNTGIYCIKAEFLTFYLPYLKNDNKQNEYYLTDIIEIIKKRENTNVEMLDIEKEKIIEIIGVNTISQLKELEILIKKLK